MALCTLDSIPITGGFGQRWLLAQPHLATMPLGIGLTEEAAT